MRYLRLGVSIHAPWEGCDCESKTISLKGCGFNSRTLGRVRLGVVMDAVYGGMFQFTHPGKGATAKSVDFVPGAEVSIHAPWEGCDSLKYL